MSKPTTNSDEVTLLKQHPHKGVAYAKGDKMSVRPDQKIWLVKEGVIAADAAATASTPEKEAK